MRLPKFGEQQVTPARVVAALRKVGGNQEKEQE
jgi:hypothetical protein